MKRAITGMMSLVVVLGLAAVSRGDVVYQSNFGTATNLASAGLAKSAGASGGSWAIDEANDRLIGIINPGGNNNARASVYTTDSWQSDLGFTLDVTFYGNAALVRHSFGIVDADYSIPSAVDSLNQSPAGAYGIGFATAGEAGADGLHFNDDAGTLTTLSTAQGNITSAANETMTITVTADSWSYSLNGAPATTGTFSTPFDTSRNYRFIAYAQSTSRAWFSNITLTEVPPVGMVFIVR